MRLATESARSRGPALTPMIDVVFLLLIFFILVARFGVDEALDLSVAGRASDTSGPPRIVDIATDSVRLNGLPVDVTHLGRRLRDMGLEAQNVLIVRPEAKVTLQRLVEVIEVLKAEGFDSIALVGGPR